MIDSRKFRDVLGAYPTGVCLVTAVDQDGRRSGMVVGSFTSISLDPPLVGFFPDKRSSTWPGIAGAGCFCVNVLGVDQFELCQRFAARGEDKFAGLSFEASPAGQPLFAGVLAWIDCSIERVEDVGDHWLVVGNVEALGRGEGTAPLLFHGGGYHSLSTLSAG